MEDTAYMRCSDTVASDPYIKVLSDVFGMRLRTWSRTWADKGLYIVMGLFWPSGTMATAGTKPMCASAMCPSEADVLTAELRAEREISKKLLSAGAPPGETGMNHATTLSAVGGGVETKLPPFGSPSELRMKLMLTG